MNFRNFNVIRDAEMNSKWQSKTLMSCWTDFSMYLNCGNK